MKSQASFVDCLAMRDEAENRLKKIKESLAYLGREWRGKTEEAEQLRRDEENTLVFLKSINAVITQRLSVSQID